MATSGIKTFNPNLGEITIAAFARCGIRRTELTQQHMSDAAFEANLVQADMQGDGIVLTEVVLQKLDIVSGQSAYTMDTTLVFLLDVWIRQNPDQANPTDRLIIPISRSDYAATANKQMPGFPTSYWLDRLMTPVLYLWPVPNFDIPQGLQFYMQQRPDNAVLADGTTVQFPYEVMDYYTWSLAERLAFIYAPEHLAMITPRKQQAWQRYLQTGTENTPLNLDVMVGSYFRVG